MTVAQGSVFIAQDSRLDSGSPDYFGIWVDNGFTAEEVLQLGALPGQGGPSSISTAAALPGALVFAVDGAAEFGPLFVTTPAYDPGRPAQDPNGDQVTPLSVTGLPMTATPADMTSIGSAVLFNAQDASGARDLWRTNGTDEGTAALAIPSAPGGLDPTNIDAFAGGALFTGRGADGFPDLFFTDGTAAGTRQIATFPATVSGGNVFDPIGTLGGRQVFVGPGAGGGSGLWSTDGTAAGTMPFAAIPAASGLPYAELGGRILYANGGGLYATDGTAAGSTEIIDFGSGYGYSSGVGGVIAVDPAGAGSAGGRVVFMVGVSGSRTASYTELYTTDGVTAQQLTTDNPATGQQVAIGAYGLAPFGARVLFAASDPGTNSEEGRALWITDGTQAGTQKLASGVDPTDITALGNGTAEFSGIGGLYVTDGTAAGTHLVNVPASSPAAAGLAPVTIQAVPSPLFFSGQLAQYDLAPTAAGALQARDLVAGRDGSLVAPDAGVLYFTGPAGPSPTLSPDTTTTAVFDPTGAAEAIARVYLAAYGQAPDTAGLLAYMRAESAGTISLAPIAEGASGSTQFQDAYGPQTDTQFVTRLYGNADGRAPDPGGLAGYVGALASGQSRGAVLLAFVDSAEARVHAQPVAGDASAATIARLYEAIDARAPDPSGQVGYTAALDAGQSVAQIAAAMLASPEYAAHFGAPGDAAFVTGLYAHLLGRAPDAGGLAAYTAALGAGETRAQLVAGFVASDEARLATAALTHEGIVLPR